MKRNTIPFFHLTFLTLVEGCLPCLVGAYWIFLTAMHTLVMSSPGPDPA